MNLIMIDISPILLFLVEFFTYFTQRNAHFFLVPILLKILLAKFIIAYSEGPLRMCLSIQSLAPSVMHQPLSCPQDQEA